MTGIKQKNYCFKSKHKRKKREIGEAFLPSVTGIKQKNYCSESKLKRKKVKTSANKKQNGRNWAELDPDILSIIFIKVGAMDLLEQAQFVCKPWQNVSFNPHIWKVAHFMKKNCKVDIALEEMAKEAVDRSKGKMEELWINSFGSDTLLSYIADRTSMLKRLRLISVDGISGEGLIGMVKRQPKLEELEITFGAYLGGKTKEIGKACPNLKCFRFNRKSMFRDPYSSYDIANTMPELRVLQLIGNLIKEKDINEILDKCIHLESLDIRCSNYIFPKIKARGLKEFRDVCDSIGDFEFGAEVISPCDVWM